MARHSSSDEYVLSLTHVRRNTPEEVTSAVKYIKTHCPSDEAREIMTILGINEKEKENG